MQGDERRLELKQIVATIAGNDVAGGWMIPAISRHRPSGSFHLVFEV
jgi:hypothetical protein